MRVEESASSILFAVFVIVIVVAEGGIALLGEGSRVSPTSRGVAVIWRKSNLGMRRLSFFSGDEEEEEEGEKEPLFFASDSWISPDLDAEEIKRGKDEGIYYGARKSIEKKAEWKKTFLLFFLFSHLILFS